MGSYVHAKYELVVVVMLIVCRYCSAQCYPAPPNNLAVSAILSSPAVYYENSKMFYLNSLMHCCCNNNIQIFDQRLVVKEQTGGQCSVYHRLDSMVCGVRFYRQTTWVWVTTLETGTILLETHLMDSLLSPTAPMTLYPTSH